MLTCTTETKPNYCHAIRVKWKRILYEVTKLVSSLTARQMVFAERGEVISGGNFHGEYPAKVRPLLKTPAFG